MCSKTFAFYFNLGYFKGKFQVLGEKALKKLLFFALMFVASCSHGRSDFQNPEQLNAWSGRAPIQELCDGLFTYQDDPYIVNRILIEFNRRNVSYMNCRQYNGPK